MRGIIAYGAYVPWWRIERAAIGAAHGGSAGRGTRAVASYDEDTTSMGVEAARRALRTLGDAGRELPETLVFATTAPSYADKTNATTVHAALRLGRDVRAFDAVGAVRSAAGAVDAALDGSRPTLVVASDVRTGMPNSPDEREGGAGAAALLIGDDRADAPVLAEYLGGASTSEEFVDRWRVPGDVRSRQWEERFGETRYVPLGTEAYKLALDAAGVGAEDLAGVIVAGPHSRAVRQVAGKVSTGTAGGSLDVLADTVGNAGAAQAWLALAHWLDTAEAGQTVAVVSLADGCDVFVFRATEALATHRPAPSVADQVAAGNPSLPYLKFLAWTGMATVQPPNRPEPARASSSAAARSEDWKYGFVGSQDHTTGAIHLPPARVSYRGGAVDDMAPLPMADATGTVVTFTVDRLAYSPSPPIVFAVVDFDGGGRLPVELTDVDAASVAMGDRVEMTFRRLNSSDGIQNYFWKARPVRG
ncbi:MAG: OB-fold domain-containing protein [Acidimicrobiales bacterium]|nr:OB-fold domain-containing protein [Acidimicrobiales bacterium]